MKNFITGLILSILPIYSLFSWLYIFNKYSGKNQEGKVQEFEKMLFNVNINQTLLGIINIVLSLLAIFFLMKCIEIKNTTMKITALIFILALVFIVFYNIWSLL